MATGLTAEQAFSLVASNVALNGNAFSVLGTIARLAAAPATSDQGRDLLIRLLERRDGLNEFEAPLLDSLVNRLGLYPYVAEPEHLSAAEQIAFEYHRPEPLDRENVVFHAMQQEIFQRLLTGESIVLSAPTSFGKSVITDALVASNKWAQIAIVVPTLALIDETRRRLARFSDRYKINTLPGQTVSTRTLFIMTQERLLEVAPFPSVGLFVIDEFYKLDSLHGENDAERGALLNIAWDRLRRTGAQYYLTGPNVTHLADTLPEPLRDSLIVTDFRTVAADHFDVPMGANDQGRLLDVCKGLSGQTLIYCRSPQRVRDVGRWLLNGGVGEVTPQGQVAASWVAENYDPEWIAGLCLANGIGLHHARIPRALQHHTVRLFNSGALRYLVCTSTLIEGVNTSAQNVLVLDSVLNRHPLDYFTFSNIRGRAGRMFRHFVGRVFLFGKSPEPTQTTIDIPIVSQSTRASPAALLQLPDDELSNEARKRLEPFYAQDLLTVEVMRKNKGIDPARQLAVAATIRNDLRLWHEQLHWSGLPTFGQTVAAAQLMLDHLVAGQQQGRVTARSLATRLNVVRQAQGRVPQMVAQQLPYSASRDDAVEDVLFFNRNWTGHIFPRNLMAIERIQADIFGRSNLPGGSYSFFAMQVENQFLSPYFVTLEEYGLPVQVALKLRRIGLGGDSLDEVLARLRVVAANPAAMHLLDPFEQEMLDEVVAGLGPAPHSGLMIGPVSQ